MSFGTPRRDTNLTKQSRKAPVDMFSTTSIWIARMLFCFHPSPQVTFSTIKPLNTTAQWMWGYRLVIHSVVF
ncbi:hypothetical protein Y032_0076g1007 [Ancylostoma ceylanicum]|uniref:Uncharacterized protein n=1 Tax=Ancylostoma ceylanicum TaxID=53326 RepID=A0A016TU55_9BILA|nr:hypothetical protein Y032_0076g1007 [Ancylostoma ceylanicum]